MSDATPTDDAVVIERVLAAPIELVWEMWVDPDHFRAWYGPDGVDIAVAEFDVRVGGRRRICMEMQTPNGPMRMWFAGEHREVHRPHRLVYSEFMADEAGQPSAQPGMPDDHPALTEVRVDFEAIDAAHTRIVMTHQGIPTDSPGATGWTMALDKLEAYAQGVAAS